MLNYIKSNVKLYIKLILSYANAKLKLCKSLNDVSTNIKVCKL